MATDEGPAGRSDAEDEVSSVSKPARPVRVPVGTLLGLLLLVNLSTSLYQLPLNRVIERRLCREFYADDGSLGRGPDGSIPEEMCKVDDVQKGLARILGVMETTWIVGDFVMTIPLGFMAEKFGSRAILLLNLVPRIWMLAWAVIVGQFEHLFPTKAFVAGPIFSFLGGDCVFNSITYALAAGSTNDSVRRATYFGYMSSISYVVALLGPAMASATMTLELWLPFFIGVGLLLLAIPAISRLQGPAPLTAGSRNDDPARPLLTSSYAAGRHSSPARAILNRFKVLQTIITSHPRNFSLLLVSFFLTSLASSDTKLLPQYISKRYSWTFASAGYLLSGKAVVNFILLTVVVPRLLRSRHLSSLRSSQPHLPDLIHLRYAKICLAVSAVGALAIAMSSFVWMLVPSLLIYALGSALPIFTLSLLKSPSMVPVDDRRDGEPHSSETHIFSIVMLVKTLGSLLGAPVMALAWVGGIAAGGAGLGMPFFFSAVFYLITIVDFSGIVV